MKNIAKKLSAVFLSAVLFSACGKSAEAVVGGHAASGDAAGVPAADKDEFWRERFAENGASPDSWEYSAEDNIFTVTILSGSDSDTASFSDIKQLRAARNTLRYSGELSEDMTYREILKTADGKILSDFETHPLRPSGIDDCSKLRKNIGAENTDGRLSESISAGDVSASVEYSPTVGNTLKINIDGGSKTRPEIEEKIRDIYLEIENYNAENFSVQQLEMISDTGGETVYFSADLVYRDFLCNFDPYFV